MRKNIVIPPKFSHIIQNAYLEVPYHDFKKGNITINAFDHPVIIRDAYMLWQHLHAKACKLSYVPYYWKDTDNETWQELLCSALNCQYWSRCEYEWWDKGMGVKLRSFGPVERDDKCFSDPYLTALFDHPEKQLREVHKELFGKK